MPPQDRRTFLKGIGAGLAVAGLGASTAGGHPAGGNHRIHRHHATKNADLVGYHSLGGFGSEDTGGKPENALPDTVSEAWVEGDYVFASYLSSTENRGVAILDASGYTRADDVEEARGAQMSLIATIGNETEAGTAADVKVSDDGDVLVYSKQAIGATYGERASTSTQVQDAPGAEPAGLIAYDISDPGEPAYIGSATGPNAGFHNCFVHEIGGDHYAFGVQGVGAGSAGVHIYRILDNGLEFVNYWGGGDLRQGEYAAPSTGPLALGFNCHDFYVQDDPKTGRPVGYVAYWNYGVRVVDLSDPTDLTELGFGEMPRAHYAQPAPTLIDGKRVFIGGQEWGSRSNQGAGFVRLFDGDALFEEEGSTKCPELDTWELYENVNYDGYTFSPHNADITKEGWITQAHYHAGIRFLKIQSPEESSTGEWRIAGKRNTTEQFGGGEHLNVEDAGESFSGIITPGALGTTRTTHEFTVPDDDRPIQGIEATLSWNAGANQQDNDLILQENLGTKADPQWAVVDSSKTLGGPESVSGPVDPGRQYRFVVETYANAASQYTIDASYFEYEKGKLRFERSVEEPALAYYRDHVEVPAAAKTDGQVSPNFWSARTENGITFGCSRHTGLYAVAAEPMDVGTRTPVDIDVARADDGTAFTAGQTDRIDYAVESDTEVKVRVRIPSSWSVVGGDPSTDTEVGDGRMVEFTDPVPAHDHSGHDHAGGETAPTRTLFVQAPAGAGATGSYTFGPFEYSTDGGETWEPVPDTDSTEYVAGIGT